MRWCLGVVVVVFVVLCETGFWLVVRTKKASFPLDVIEKCAAAISQIEGISIERDIRPHLYICQCQSFLSLPLLILPPLLSVSFRCAI